MQVLRGSVDWGRGATDWYPAIWRCGRYSVRPRAHPAATLGSSAAGQPDLKASLTFQVRHSRRSSFRVCLSSGQTKEAVHPLLP